MTAIRARNVWLVVAIVLSICVANTTSEELGPLASAFRIMIAPARLDQAIRVIKPNQKIAVEDNTTFDLSCYTSLNTLTDTFTRWMPSANLSEIEMAWFKDGRPFQHSAHARVTGWLNDEIREDYQIRFNSFSPEDGGEYQCHVRLGVFKLTINATIGVKPYLIVEPKSNEYVEKGKNLALQCLAIGYPQPDVHWRNVKTGKVVARHSHLFMMTLRRRNSGLYRCVASNSLGEASSLTNLVVTEPLEWIGKSSRLVSVRLGYHSALECHAKGYPAPSVQWTFTPSVLCSDPNAPTIAYQPQPALLNVTGWRLHIADVMPSELGVYACTVSSKWDTENTQEPLHSSTCLTVDAAAHPIQNDLETSGSEGNSTYGLEYSSATSQHQTASYLLLGQFVILSVYSSARW